MTRTESSRSSAAASPSRLRSIEWSLGIWSSMGLYQFADDVVNAPGRWPRSSLLAIELTVSYIWAFLTPVVVALARRFPIERPRVGRNVAVHLTLSILFAMGVIVLSDLVIVSFGIGRSFMVQSFMRILVPALVGGFHQHFYTYWVVVAVYHAIRYHQAYIERDAQAASLALRAAELKRDLGRAQYRALKAQLEPHFLYNTLNTIMVLVRQRSQRSALEMLSGLHKLLDCVVRDADAEEVPLDRELEYVRLYLAIEQFRFRDRLQVEISVEPGLRDAAVAYMCLQPIVENAIRYGVAQKSAAGTILIKASREHDTLRLLVQDDGVGFGTPTFSKGRGIGIANTRARLETLYAGLAALEVERGPQGGTIATIVVPYRTLTNPACTGG